MKPDINPVNMFVAACYTFAKTMGKRSLHEVPSLDEKDNIKPFQLVVKSRRRKWVFFEKAVYGPTDFQVITTLFSPYKSVT